MTSQVRRPLEDILAELVKNDPIDDKTSKSIKSRIEYLAFLIYSKISEFQILPSYSDRLNLADLISSKTKVFKTKLFKGSKVVQTFSITIYEIKLFYSNSETSILVELAKKTDYKKLTTWWVVDETY